MDVGPSLKSPYYYADDEIRDLIDSEALCALFSPLPAALLREIVSGQAQRGRQKEDERQVSRDRDHDLDGSIRSRLLGSMEMSNPVERSLGEAREVFIPTIYLLNI
ncbi:hypothetical protein C0993_011254, partial [Termitomyces sp. T159_Od127]